MYYQEFAIRFILSWTATGRIAFVRFRPRSCPVVGRLSGGRWTGDWQLEYEPGKRECISWRLVLRVRMVLMAELERVIIPPYEWIGLVALEHTT